MRTRRHPALRLIARFVLLLAVLLMPFGMSAAPAVAQPTALSGASMPHCPDQPPSDHGRSGIAECTMICSAALHAVYSAVEEPPVVVPARPTMPVTSTLHGILLETSTPPPKFF